MKFEKVLQGIGRRTSKLSDQYHLEPAYLPKASRGTQCLKDVEFTLTYHAEKVLQGVFHRSNASPRVWLFQDLPLKGEACRETSQRGCRTGLPVGSSSQHEKLSVQARGFPAHSPVLHVKQRELPQNRRGQEHEVARLCFWFSAVSLGLKNFCLTQGCGPIV